MIPNNSFFHIFRIFLSSAVLRAIGLSAAFLCSLILARALGPEEYGFYSYIIALVMIGSILPQFGLSTFVVRETAKGMVGRDYSRIRSIWSWSLLFILTLSGVMFVTSLFMSEFLFSSAMMLQGKLAFWGGLLLIPLFAIAKARAAALRGLDFIWQSQFPETAVKPVLFAVLLSFFYYSTFEKTAGVAMLLHLLSAFFTSVIGFWMLSAYTPVPIKKAKIDLTESKSWFKTILPLGTLGAIQTISNQIDIILLGSFRSDIEVGIYKVVASLATLGLFGLQITNLITATKISSFFSEGDIVRLQKVSSLGALFGTLFTIPVSIFFMLLGDRVIHIFYGSEYIEGYVPLIILVLGQMISALFGSVAVLLNMSGNEKYSLKWLGISTLVNIILNFMWIPGYGLIGAASATLISTVIWNLAFWRIAKARVGIDGSVLSVYRLFKERERV